MRRYLIGLSVIGVVLAAAPAQAYVGPGLGLGVLGVIGGILMSVVLAVFSLVWYPLKRLLGIGKKKTQRQETSAAGIALASAESPEQ